MEKKTKLMLKHLIENETNIPLWPSWLQHNKKLRIKRNGNFVWRNQKGKEIEATWKTFFKRQWLWDEREIKDILDDYFLFLKSADELTARDILRCKNAEIRRRLLNLYGFDKFVEKVHGKVLHRDGSSELIEIKWRKEEALKVVKVRDSTTREIYLLRVPPSVKTCKEAIAWTFGLSEEDYNPIKET